MSEQEITTTRPSIKNRLSSDGVLGALVALLSILTAFVGFEAYLADDNSNDMQIEAIKALTESNTMYLEANQDIIVDYSQFDNYYVNLGEDDDLADYFYGNFSMALTNSMEREDGPFDEPYYEEMFSDAEVTYEQALDTFDEAENLGDAAEEFQFIMLISAVGLALSAWSSLVKPGTTIRMTFMIIGIVAFVFSVGAYVIV